jgi:hypothetical protein
MKRLRLLFILLLTACAAPLTVPEDDLQEQVQKGQFALRVNYPTQRVSLQQFSVRAPNLVMIDRNAFTGKVQLSLEQQNGSALPSGISVRFSPNNTSSSKSIMVISIGTQVTPQTYALRIKGVSGTLTKYVSFDLVVSPANTTWTSCVQVTWAQCDFDGLREVRFGTNGKYVSKLFFDYVSTCLPSEFDGVDPAPGESKSCSYGPMKAKRITNPNPANGLGTAVLVPLGDTGSAELRMQATTQQPSPSDGTGAFRVVCDYSHMAFDDPIIYPGQPGASHLHTFFGNTRTSAASTSQSIAKTGNSTCRGGIANRSSYWVPTLLDAQKKPIMPSSAVMYYKTGYAGVDPASVKRIPDGLRMIAGNANSSGVQEYTMVWGCLDNYISNTGFIPAASRCLPNLDGNTYIQQSIIFPQCWDGVNLDSLNHKSHMSYPIVGQGCPSSHPVALPEITINVRYKIPPSGTTGWRLSSDTYSTSLPGGFSLHGDFMNGWRPEIADMWIRNCDNPALDCHADLLGEGKTLY